MEQIFEILNDLNIPYELQEHKAIFSEEDSKDVVITLEGTDVKNLFVKDKNNNYGLVSLDLHKRADLKKIAAAFGVSVNSSLNYSTHSPRILKGVISMFQGSSLFQSSAV